MAVPSSGSLSLFRIANEKNVNDYTDDDTETQDYGGISLRGVSNNSFDDFGTGNININTDGWSSPANTSGQTGSAIQTDPYSMSEFYGYDHDFVAEIHSTTFQPEAREWVVPYQPVRKGSGFTTSLASGRNEPTNIGTVTTQGTFDLGGKTGVNLAALYNYDSTASPAGSSTTGETIVLQFHHASGTNFSNTGWNTAKIYNGSSSSGTLVITLTRSSATSYSSTIQNSTNVRATHTFDGSRAFSTYFGNSTTASSNDQHFLLIE
jgi:hypothetical protein